MKLGLGVTLLTCFLAACGGDDDDDNTGDGGGFPDASGDATGGPSPLNCDDVVEIEDPVDLELQEVASGLNSPGAAVWAPGDPRMYVIELYTGKILIIEDGEPLPTPFLDIGNKIRADDEEGFLGLVFHPDYEDNGRFFVHYTKSGNGNNMIEEYTRSPGNPDVASTTPKLILEIPGAYQNHNGGHLAFGPDGYLYIGLGDGGGGNDEPLKAAQDPTDPYGSMLRIDVDGGDPFSVPASNPDFGNDATPGTWAIGLRNPWRYSFDAANGNLYIADVGQEKAEEVTVVPAGDGGYNFGWSCYEGTMPFALDDTTRCPNANADITQPQYEYDRTGTNGSITGGYVYRGCKMKFLRGTYFFGDIRLGFIRSFVYSGGQATGVKTWGSGNPDGDLSEASLPSSFGQDHQGELYIVNMGFGAGTGAVYKIVPKN